MRWGARSVEYELVTFVSHPPSHPDQRGRRVCKCCLSPLFFYYFLSLSFCISHHTCSLFLSLFLQDHRCQWLYARGSVTSECNLKPLAIVVVRSDGRLNTMLCLQNLLFFFHTVSWELPGTPLLSAIFGKSIPIAFILWAFWMCTISTANPGCASRLPERERDDRTWYLGR
jgi:hypothetical protein